MLRRVEMRCLLGDALAEVLELSVHEDWLSPRSDILRTDNH
jgi:hypothetical protein